MRKRIGFFAFKKFRRDPLRCHRDPQSTTDRPVPIIPCLVLFNSTRKASMIGMTSAELVMTDPVTVWMNSDGAMTNTETLMTDRDGE